MNEFKLAFLVFAIVMLVGRALSFSACGAEQSVMRVPYDYPTIQEAVNAASPDSIILVNSGTYYEHVIVNKTLTLIGEDKANTIIDGGGTGAVIKVEADNVLVDGFTTRSGTFGIYVEGCNDTISGSIMMSNQEGIRLSGSNITVLRNIIANNDYNGICWIGHRIYENSFVNSRCEFVGCGENIIHHNNFINSPIMDELSMGNNTWDENFWDEETIIASSPRVRALDNNPLNAPYGSIPVILENIVYPVSFVSNLTLLGMGFSQASKSIEFIVEESAGTIGVCNITIPKNLLRGPWTIQLGLVDVTSQTIIVENETHTTISLMYIHNSTEEVIRITGTWVVPEFPSSITLAIPMILFTALTITIKLKKRLE
jgi:parallel beta-helix repeat protein